MERYVKKCPFWNKYFSYIKSSIKNIFELGGFDSHMLFWIIQVPFCQTEVPFF